MSKVDISRFRHLSVAERLQLAEALWNSVAEDVEADPRLLPISEAQQAIIRARAAAHLANPDDVVPADDVLDGLERRLK